MAGGQQGVQHAEYLAEVVVRFLLGPLLLTAQGALLSSLLAYRKNGNESVMWIRIRIMGDFLDPDTGMDQDPGG